MGTLFGPVIGAFMLVFITQVVLGRLLDFHLFATGLLLVILVLAAPGGVLGLSVLAAAAPSCRGARGMSASPILRSTACRRTSAAWRRSPTCPLPSSPARSPASSAPTAPANPRCSTSSPAIFRRAPARSISRTGGSRAWRPTASPSSASRGLPDRPSVPRPQRLRQRAHRRAVRQSRHRATSPPPRRAAWSCRASPTWPISRRAALTVGQLRHLEVARAIATRADLLLADEPCAGLNPDRDRGHDRGVAPHPRQRRHRRAGRARHAVGDGSLRPAAGARCRPPDRRRPAAEVATNPQVIAAYLGTPERKRRTNGPRKARCT